MNHLIQENINFPNTIKLIDYGVVISGFPKDKFPYGLKIHGLYRTNQKDLFTKTKTEISSNRNEFNSFVEVAEFFKPTDKLYLGLSLELKF